MSTTKVAGIFAAEIFVTLHEVPLHLVKIRSVFGSHFVNKESFLTFALNY
jgi:hypothetical protein